MNQKLAALVGRHVMQGEPRRVGAPDMDINDSGLRWPDYPGDMGQAWHVVERMRGLGFQFVLWYWRTACAKLHKSDGSGYTAEHSNPATAICLAALAALGVPYGEVERG